MRTQWQMTGVDESQLHFLEICKQTKMSDVLFDLFHFPVDFGMPFGRLCSLQSHSHSLHLNEQWHIKNKCVGSFSFYILH